MDMSITPTSSLDTKPRVSFGEFTNKMSDSLMKMDSEYTKMGSAFVQKIENIIPLPSEQRFVQDMLKSTSGPQGRLARETLKISDEQAIFARELLRKKLSGAVAGVNMNNAIKGSSLVINGLKQLISAS